MDRPAVSNGLRAEKYMQCLFSGFGQNRPGRWEGHCRCMTHPCQLLIREFDNFYFILICYMYVGSSYNLLTAVSSMQPMCPNALRLFANRMQMIYTENHIEILQVINAVKVVYRNHHALESNPSVFLMSKTCKE